MWMWTWVEEAVLASVSPPQAVTFALPSQAGYMTTTTALPLAISAVGSVSTQTADLFAVLRQIRLR